MQVLGGRKENLFVLFSDFLHRKTSCDHVFPADFNCANFRSVHLHLTIVDTLPATRCVPLRAPGHCGDKEVGRVRGCTVCAGLLQTGSPLRRRPGSETYRPTGGWKKICFYVWLEGAKNMKPHGRLGSSPVSGSLAPPTGKAAGRPTGPGAPHAGALAAVIGAEELPIGAAAVVAVGVVPTPSSPHLTQRVHAVALPQLHAHSVLLQLAFTHTTRTSYLGYVHPVTCFRVLSQYCIFSQTLSDKWKRQKKKVKEGTQPDLGSSYTHMHTQPYSLIKSSLHAFGAATARLTFGAGLALDALLEVCTALWTLVGAQHKFLAWWATFLIWQWKNISS